VRQRWYSRHGTAVRLHDDPTMTMLRGLGRFLREITTEQVQFRHLLYEITARDIHLRYKQAIMGFGWAIFMPLLNTIVFAVVFTRMAPIETRVPYPVFAYTGLLAWQLTASSLRFAVVSLTTNTTLVTKVYFPREILPFSAVLVTVIDTAVASVVLAVMMAYYRIPLTPAALFVPVIIVTQLCLTSGLALMLAMGNLFFRDVKYLFEIAVNVWMFASSTIYPIGKIGGAIGTVLALNPMTPILDAYRDVLLFGRMPDLSVFAATAALSLAVLMAGWAMFHVAEFTFAENV
jgi:ABC-type polysaccharide/polyol phosphate export permease